MAEELLFTKIVDKSTLYEGISIPVAYHSVVYDIFNFSLNKGEQQPLTIQMNGYIYNEVSIKNQAFDESKYPNRADIIQIRYGKQSLIAKAMREIFSSSLELVDAFYASKTVTKTKTNFIVPEERREYVVLYIKDGMIRFDCVARQTTHRWNPDKDYGEDVPQRKELISPGFKRNANVIELAKQRAKGVCQLCGLSAPFNDKQGNPYLEVHHIIWLSRDGSDKLSNTVALCPNCHSRMHIVDDELDIKVLLDKAKAEKQV